jgi:hypothetical protein
MLLKPGEEDYSSRGAHAAVAWPAGTVWVLVILLTHWFGPLVTWSPRATEC